MTLVTAALPLFRRGKVREIAELKMKDLNAHDIDAAMRMIEGSARSMGVNVQD